MEPLEAVIELYVSEVLVMRIYRITSIYEKILNFVKTLMIFAYETLAYY